MSYDSGSNYKYPKDEKAKPASPLPVEGDSFLKKLMKETGAGKKLCLDAMKALESEYINLCVDYIRRFGPKF